MIKQKLACLGFIGIVGFNFSTPKLAAWWNKNPQKNATAPGLQKQQEKRLEKFAGKKVAIGAGEVIVKDGTTLTIQKDGKAYTVLTDEKTKFRRRFWGKSSLDEISVNDLILVIGKWTNEEKTEIRAVLIRNLSVQKRRGAFFGKVKSVSATGFVMETAKREDQTVTLDSATKLVNRKMETITLNDIKVGHRVRVKGLWDNENHTITEVKQVKDFSIPLAPPPSPSPKSE